jgi:hypothetical protein
MDLEKLRRKAEQIYTKRGGAEAAKGDATEVEGILKGEGTFMDKAKRAAKALKQPGAARQPGGADATGPGPATTPPQTEPSSGMREQPPATP